MSTPIAQHRFIKTAMVRAFDLQAVHRKIDMGPVDRWLENAPDIEDPALFDWMDKQLAYAVATAEAAARKKNYMAGLP